MITTKYNLLLLRSIFINITNVVFSDMIRTPVTECGIDCMCLIEGVK